MKRTPLLLTLGLILVVLGYFAYQKFFAAKKFSQWDFVPDQTVLVYEAGNCEDCIASIQELPIWKIYQTLLQRSQKNDSIGQSLDFLSTPKPGQLISLHVTQKDDFDFLFYIPEKQVLLTEGFNKLMGQSAALISNRELNGERIHEIHINDQVFSWTVLEGFWMGSYTPFLVEDVIRTYTLENRSEFLHNVAGVSQLPRIKNDAGNIYVNYDRFFDWLSVFLQQRPKEFGQFGQSSLFDIKQSSNSITVNGFSLSSEENSFLSIYNDQTPVPGIMKQYISDRTLAAVVHGISNGDLLFEKLDISTQKSDQDSLSRMTGTDLKEIYASLGKEIAICYLEGRVNSVTKVIGFNTSDPKTWLEFFEKLSDATETEDTVFYEKYSTYEIREIELRNLPGKLFSPLTSGFDRTYYTSIGSTILMAPQLEELKLFLDDIDNEEVWGKSVSYNKFLESTLLESNFSVFINTPNVWNSLSNMLSPRWKKFVLENQETLRSMDLGAIQFSHLNESFYTNAVWTHLGEGTKGKPAIATTDRIIANLNYPIVAGPFIIRNHASKQDEIIVQDSLYNIYQLDANGKMIWTLPLNGPILGDVHQIDYFKNNKLQLFFATSERLHVIDRLGHYVSPFPIKTQASDIGFTKVIDYDKSKNYRFMVTDRRGKLWLYDKEGDNLDGWRPKSIDEVLSTGANHHRIRSKDFMIAIRRDGWAHLMNRRGEDSKGFPLDLDSRPEGEYYLETGNSFSLTNFVVVSRDGFRVKFNLEGKVVSKETLIKPTIDTQFSLIKELNSKGYVIRRQDAKRISILNESLEEIARCDYIGTSPSRIQYYDFGSGRVYVVVGDLSQDLFFIYDGSGTLLTRTPLEGTGLEIRLDESGKPKIYRTVENRVVIQAL